MSALLETCDRLLEFMPALRALEFDQVRVTHGAAQYGIDLRISAKGVIGTATVGTKPICLLSGVSAVDLVLPVADQTRLSEAMSAAPVTRSPT
ncbi:MAG: hypothetical protein WBS19_15070 [Candidatus Korobacteraceae bacterium]